MTISRPISLFPTLPTLCDVKSRADGRGDDDDDGDGVVHQRCCAMLCYASGHAQCNCQSPPSPKTIKIKTNQNSPSSSSCQSAFAHSCYINSLAERVLGVILMQRSVCLLCTALWSRVSQRCRHGVLDRLQSTSATMTTTTDSKCFLGHVIVMGGPED